MEQISNTTCTTTTIQYFTDGEHPVYTTVQNNTCLLVSETITDTDFVTTSDSICKSSIDTSMDPGPPSVTVTNTSSVCWSVTYTSEVHNNNQDNSSSNNNNHVVANSANSVTETQQYCTFVSDSYTQSTDPPLSVLESTQTCTITTQITSDPEVPPVTSQSIRECYTTSGPASDPFTSDSNDTCRLLSGTLDYYIDPLAPNKQKPITLY